MREGSDTFLVHAYLPVAASFGLADDLRRRCSGAASISLLLSHWERIQARVLSHWERIQSLETRSGTGAQALGTRSGKGAAYKRVAGGRQGPACLAFGNPTGQLCYVGSLFLRVGRWGAAQQGCL